MTDPDDPLPEGTLISHLLELRSRLLKAFIAVMIAFLPCAYYSNAIFDFLSTPLVAMLPPGQKLIATTVTATFTAPLKLAFVAPGLYRREKRFAVPLLISAIVLFYMGVAFSYFLVFPLVFRFFIATTPRNVMLMADISNYLKFVLTLFVAFGVAFETPVAVVLLVLTKLVSLQKLRSMRSYVLIIVFVIAAILTPPDVLSQTAMAVPMYLLYEGGILFAALLSRSGGSTSEAGEQEST
ncbi:MAG: twin-arginine translocase subunit TatC [Steroidobacteraceae bacterium]